MNKPITIIADEFNNKLVNLINESGLPFFIIESIMNNLINEIHYASKKQLEMDKTKYLNSLKNEDIQTSNNNISSSLKDGD